jgi:hypothetical protein
MEGKKGIEQIPNPQEESMSSNPLVKLHPGPSTMDDVLKWTSKVSKTVGKFFTTPKPEPEQIIFSMFHSSEFPFEGGVPTSPFQLKSPEAQQMDQAVIVPDKFEIEPIDSENPEALQNRRHRTYAKTGFSLYGNVVTNLGFYSEVTSTELLLGNNDVLQIGGLEDQAKSESFPNPGSLLCKMVNSWRFGGGKYLGEAEGRNLAPSLFGPFGALLGGKFGEWITPPNYASVSCLLIPPTDTEDGVLVANTTYQPLATHHFGFKLSTWKWEAQWIMTKQSTTNDPADARKLKSDIDAFRIGHQNGEITHITLEEALGIFKQRNVLKPLDALKAIDNQTDTETEYSKSLSFSNFS